MFHEYEKILVPIDGSKEAKLAFDKAIEVAKRNHPLTRPLKLLNEIMQSLC